MGSEQGNSHGIKRKSESGDPGNEFNVEAFIKEQGGQITIAKLDTLEEAMQESIICHCVEKDRSIIRGVAVKRSSRGWATTMNTNGKQSTKSFSSNKYASQGHDPQSAHKLALLDGIAERRKIESSSQVKVSTCNFKQTKGALLAIDEFDALDEASREAVVQRGVQNKMTVVCGIWCNKQ